MTPTGSNKNNKIVISINLSTEAANILTNELEETTKGKDRQAFRETALKGFQKLEQSGDIFAIIEAEKNQLKREKSDLPGTDKRMNSLSTAINEMEIIEDFLYRVRDHEGYQFHATGLTNPKQWSGDLPNDSARLAFGSHITRLQNDDVKADDKDKILILKQRQINFKIALDIYMAMQKKALGPVKAPSRARDNENEMGMGY